MIFCKNATQNIDIATLPCYNVAGLSPTTFRLGGGIYVLH